MHTHADPHTHTPPNTRQGHAQTKSMGTFCSTQARVPMMNVEHKKLFTKKTLVSIKKLQLFLFFLQHKQ